MAFAADYFQTLVAAGTLATESLTLPNQVLDSVFLDYDANLATFGTTVNITIPSVDENNATDIGNGGITGVTPADTLVPVVLAHKFSSNRKIPDFDQIRSNPFRLAEIYIKPVVEEVLRKTNRSLAALITAANFNVHTPVSGSGANYFKRADISEAWANLRGVGVPVGDPNDLTMLVDSHVYGNMMSNTEYADWTVQGMDASQVNRRAVLLNQYSALIKDDPMLPVTSGVYTGILMHKFAIALRTALMGPPEGSAVIQTVIYPRPQLPIHTQLWYEPKDQSWYIHGFLPCGYAVARPSHGCIMYTA